MLYGGGGGEREKESLYGSYVSLSFSFNHFRRFINESSSFGHLTIAMNLFSSPNSGPNPGFSIAEYPKCEPSWSAVFPTAWIELWYVALLLYNWNHITVLFKASVNWHIF